MRYEISILSSDYRYFWSVALKHLTTVVTLNLRHPWSLNTRVRFTDAWSISDANASENWWKLFMQFEIFLVAKCKDD